MIMSNFSEQQRAEFCDRGMVFCLCAMIFVLPASIAILDSLAALAVLLYVLKKVNRLAAQWPSAAHVGGLRGRITFMLGSLAPPENPVNRSLQFLALAVLASVLLSQYPHLSIKAFFGKFIKCVFLFLVFLEAVNCKRRVWLFLASFLLSAFITSASGIFQHYTGKDFIKGRSLGTENFVTINRVSSSFAGANAFGPYLLPVIAFTIQLLFMKFDGGVLRYSRAGVLVLLIVLMTCLCWTYSRSSWLGFLVILAVTSLLDRRKAMAAGALLLVFIFFFLPSLKSIRHMTLMTDSSAQVTAAPQKSSGLYSLLEDGGSGRFAFWKTATAVISTSPVLGTGLNTYARVLMRQTNPKDVWYAHNGYLQMTAETGIIGLACFLWMLFVLLAWAIRASWSSGDTEMLPILQACISAVFALLVQGFFDNTFYTVQLSMLMWMIFGFTAALARLNGRTN